MKIRKFGKSYKVESSIIGKFYIVDPIKPSCDCPHFKYRLVHNGGECKHIAATKEKIYAKQDTIEKRILKRFEENEKIDAVSLIEEFGEILINDMIEKGDLLEEKGFLKMLQ